MSKEYHYSLSLSGPTDLIVIDPDTLSKSQKESLLKGTDGFARGINYWHMKREDFKKERKDAK